MFQLAPVKSTGNYLYGWESTAGEDGPKYTYIINVRGRWTLKLAIYII
jgi:hypothetical protein